jgi:hypothetical protein
MMSYGVDNLASQFSRKKDEPFSSSNSKNLTCGEDFFHPHFLPISMRNVCVEIFRMGDTLKEFGRLGTDTNSVNLNPILLEVRKP